MWISGTLTILSTSLNIWNDVDRLKGMYFLLLTKYIFVSFINNTVDCTSNGDSNTAISCCVQTPTGIEYIAPRLAIYQEIRIELKLTINLK